MPERAGTSAAQPGETWYAFGYRTAQAGLRVDPSGMTDSQHEQFGRGQHWGTADLGYEADLRNPNTPAERESWFDFGRRAIRQGLRVDPDGMADWEHEEFHRIETAALTGVGDVPEPSR